MHAQSAHHLLLSDATIAAAFHGPDVIAPTLAAATWHTALADITRLLDRPGLPDTAVASSIRQLFAERPIHGLTAALGPGATGESAARLIGGLLLATDVPFTRIVAELTRHLGAGPPRIDPYGPMRGRVVTAGEAADLGLPAAEGLTCWERRGLMMAGTTVVAETALVLVAEKITPAELAALEAGAPAGDVLDATRTSPAVCLAWPADPAMRCSAVLERDGRRMGLARERVTAGFLDRLAKTTAA
jgi:hypothetical protein